MRKIKRALSFRRGNFGRNGDMRNSLCSKEMTPYPVPATLDEVCALCGAAINTTLNHNRDVCIGVHKLINYRTLWLTMIRAERPWRALRLRSAQAHCRPPAPCTAPGFMRPTPAASAHTSPTCRELGRGKRRFWCCAVRLPSPREGQPQASPGQRPGNPTRRARIPRPDSQRRPVGAKQSPI